MAEISQREQLNVSASAQIPNQSFLEGETGPRIDPVEAIRLHQLLSSNMAAAYTSVQFDNDFTGSDGYNVESFSKFPLVPKEPDSGVHDVMANMTRFYSDQMDSRIAFHQVQLSQGDLEKLPDFIKNDLPRFVKVE